MPQLFQMGVTISERSEIDPSVWLIRSARIGRLRCFDGPAGLSLFNAELDIDDDGSAFITTSHATLEGFFVFDHESVARLTLIP